MLVETLNQPWLRSRPAGRDQADRVGRWRRERRRRNRSPAGPVVVAITKLVLTAFIAISAEHGGNLQLNQLLQAVAHQLRDQLPSTAAIQ